MENMMLTAKILCCMHGTIRLRNDLLETHSRLVW